MIRSQKMSGKRFKLNSNDENEPSEFFTDYGDLWEDGTPKTYWFDDYEDFEDVVGLLNELAEENGALKKFIKDNFNEMMDSKMVR